MSQSDIAISVRGLSKAYTIAHNQEKHVTLAETVLARLKNPLRRPKTETFWALKDIDFDIKKGDVVGIIGRNGAGKSTLLKILSRITEPTSGEIKVRGRIGSLLEVGTGFHPELTGRENIFLNGAILGMTKPEIKKQFDAIVDFAGVQQFLDTPVKRYSSGMYVRLAFAVAAHLESEVLIVDEVLAVGDAEFQRKCLGKIEDVAACGRTVLIVSHNLGTIARMSATALMLHRGRMHCAGDVSDAIRAYIGITSSATDNSVGIRYSYQDMKPIAPVQLQSCSLLDQTGEHCGTFDSTCPVTIEIRYKVNHTIHRLRTAVVIRTVDGTPVFSSNDRVAPEMRDMPRLPGVYVSRCTIPADYLNRGTYLISVSADEPGLHVFFDETDFLILNIEQTSGFSTEFNETWQGVICPRLPWCVRVVQQTLR